MNETKLSYIIPIYNVERYLRKCVESLIMQDYDDCEILLVDDGSTDGSDVLADAIASEYYISNPNIQIRVIHQMNAGVSAARNTGLRAAQGEYVCFVDSDDYWQPNVLGTLMAQVERENLDVLRFDFQNVRIGDGGQYEVFEPNKAPHRVDKRTDISNGIAYLNERMDYACYPVMYIIRRNMLVDETGNGILFTEGIHYEDVDWTPRMLLAAKRVNSTTTVVYNYLRREGSITQVGMDMAKKHQNMEFCMFVVERLGILYKQNPSCRWIRCLESMMAAGVINNVVRNFPEERNMYVQRIKSMGAFPLRIIANQGRTYMRRAVIMNISTSLYTMLVKLKILRR